MSETIEMIESRIIPVEKPGMMIVQAPNGLMVQAPIEIWLAAIMAQLSDADQAMMCDRVVKMTLEHNKSIPGQIIDPRQASSFDCIKK